MHLLFFVLLVGTQNILSDSDEPLELTKCCRENQIIDLDTNDCVYSSVANTNYTLDIVDFVNKPNTFAKSISLVTISNRLFCPKHHHENFKFDIYLVGDVYIVINKFTGEANDPKDFCFDFGKHEDSDNEVELIAQKCQDCTEHQPCLNFCCGKNFQKERFHFFNLLFFEL